MQMLFLQSAVDKMDDNFGRAAIIENSSPLFTGGTASGESQIRRWFLEQDLIEAIIQLPNDLFYNTGISTFIWVLSKNKRPDRVGKVQLIDASNIYHKLRRGLGDKKNEIAPEDRARITRIYSDFKKSDVCKIYNNEDFLYREYAVMQPLQRSYSIDTDSIRRMIQIGSLSTIYDEGKIAEYENSEELSGKEQKKYDKFIENKPVYENIIQTLESNVSGRRYYSLEEFLPVLMNVLSDVTAEKKLIEKIAAGLSIMDKSAVIQKDRKGKVIFDKESKDTEKVLYTENIDDYMAREVLPFVPDAVAFFEENLGVKKPVIKTGAEIIFTRYFYKYSLPESSDLLKREFEDGVKELSQQISDLFN